MIRFSSSSTPITPVEAGSTMIGCSFSSFARAFVVLLATLSPDLVAQLALPALIRIGAAHSFREAHVGAGQFDRRGLHFVLGEHGGGGRGYTRNDQRKIVLLLFANASVCGGVFISKR